MFINKKRTISREITEKIEFYICVIIVTNQNLYAQCIKKKMSGAKRLGLLAFIFYTLYVKFHVQWNSKNTYCM